MCQYKQAFTLIELLVIILIIGVLASVALSQYQIAVAKSHAVEAITMLKAITNAQEVYFLANGDYTNNLSELDIQIIEGKYYRINCREKRTCDALPKISGLPVLQFHMAHQVSTSAKDYFLGKHWCEGSSEQKEKICKTLGTLDESMLNTGHGKYYLLNS